MGFGRGRQIGSDVLDFSLTLHISSHLILFVNLCLRGCLCRGNHRSYVMIVTVLSDHAWEGRQLITLPKDWRYAALWVDSTCCLAVSKVLEIFWWHISTFLVNWGTSFSPILRRAEIFGCSHLTYSGPVVKSGHHLGLNLVQGPRCLITILVVHKLTIIGPCMSIVLQDWITGKASSTNSMGLCEWGPSYSSCGSSQGSSLTCCCSSRVGPRWQHSVQ